jgi:hypothetical protein
MGEDETKLLDEKRMSQKNAIKPNTPTRTALQSKAPTYQFAAT